MNLIATAMALIITVYRVLCYSSRYHRFIYSLSPNFLNHRTISRPSYNIHNIKYIPQRYSAAQYSILREKKSNSWLNRRENSSSSDSVEKHENQYNDNTIDAESSEALSMSVNTIDDYSDTNEPFYISLTSENDFAPNTHSFTKSMNYNDLYEKCIIVAVNQTSHHKHNKLTSKKEQLSLNESLNELMELLNTAKIQPIGICIQRLREPHAGSYIGSGKINQITQIAQEKEITTLVFDDDLSARQQAYLDSKFNGTVKVLDRTAVILDIFAKRANTKESQLQVELAMLEYRLTRGPRASGDKIRDSGAGFRGPGETKLETNKRIIRDKIIDVKKNLEKVKIQRNQHRMNREQLGLPIVTICGYTNAGKSSLMNYMSKANILAEDMLFATLDTTIRKVRISSKNGLNTNELSSMSSQVMLIDTVGFISKLPTSLVAAFRSTLEEVNNADILIHVIDRSNPSWMKQRETVMRELRSVIGEKIYTIPIIEIWNKIDLFSDPKAIREEARDYPIDVEILSKPSESENQSNIIANNYIDDDDDDDDGYIVQDIDSIETIKSSVEVKTPIKNNHSNSNIRVVAMSLKSGEGIDDFYSALVEIATVNLRGMDIEIPFDKDNGLSALIRNTCVVEKCEFTDNSSIMSIKVPSNMISYVLPFVRS